MSKSAESQSHLDIFVENENVVENANVAVSLDETPRRTRCRPFILTVMVYSPESGYKFEVEVEKNCSPMNEALWGFSFKLQKKIDKEFVELVSVTYKAKNPPESEGVKAMATEGITDKQLDILENDVYPITKVLGEESRQPTSEEREKIDSSMTSIVL